MMAETFINRSLSYTGSTVSIFERFCSFSKYVKDFIML